MEKPVPDPRGRDETVDRLMRRTLGATKASAVTGACLDAETLAAWMDGGLSGAALDAARLHVADCARCQALVGTFARLDRALPPMAAAPRAARRWLAWLVPIAAAAAAVTLWIVVPGRSPAPAPTAAPAAADEVSRFEPATPPASNRPLASPAPRANAAAPERQATGVGKVAGAPAAAQAPAASKESTQQDAFSVATAAPRALMRAAAAPASPEIAAPDSSVRWRITPSGVERSTDAGTTWTATPTGITAELTAGAAASGSVCWLVGKAGVVLVSTDGQSWRRVPFPEATDLSAVRTTDAAGLAASVTTSAGRTFRTTDGGATWVPLQEF